MLKEQSNISDLRPLSLQDKDFGPRLGKRSPLTCFAPGSVWRAAGMQSVSVKSRCSGDRSRCRIPCSSCTEPQSTVEQGEIQDASCRSSWTAVFLNSAG